MIFSYLTILIVFVFHKNAKIAVHKQMWEFMNIRKNVFVDSYEEGIKRVRESKGKYAFLIESAHNDYINEQLPCDTLKVGRNLDAKGYGIATPRQSPIRCVTLRGVNCG